MKKNNLTIGIYGTPDTERKSYPVFVHDHNISIFKEGKLLHYLQLERITKRKYDNRLDELLYKLLKEKKLLTGSVPTTVFVDNVVGGSFISSYGDIRFEAPINRSIIPKEEEGVLRWLGQQTKGYVISHELAHIYSSVPFYGIFKNNSLLIHFDGGASNSNFSAWKYDKGKLALLECHWKLKWLTSFFNANPITFALTGGNIKNQNGVPGKIMGLAAYGKYREELEHWLNRHQFFQHYWGRKKMILQEINQRWGLNISGFEPSLSFFQDVVATMQTIFIRETMNEIRKFKQVSGAEYLYFTGGSALNIALNAHLLGSGMFKEVFIPPCTNDSGLSLGAAAFIELKKHGKVGYVSPYINNWNIDHYQTELNYLEIRKISEKIAQGEVIAVCNGKAEAGPRALGNRSIIARADSIPLAKKISTIMKKREWYRPLAPVMLEGNATRFTGINKIPNIARYMLIEFQVLPSKKEELKGAMHVNGSSRIQVLFNEGDNPFIWNILQVLQHEHGISAILNTSFNEAGKPLTHTKPDAIETAKNMSISWLVFNGSLLHL